MAFTSPEAAEAAFYQSFQDLDLEGMAALWSRDEQVVCVHPMSQPLQGPGPVMRSWRGIFESGREIRFRVETLARWRVAGLAVHVVREHIRDSDGRPLGSAMIATNVFRKEEDGWRMLSHQAAPDGGGSDARPGPRRH